jgi:TPR repeat protein
MGDQLEINGLPNPFPHETTNGRVAAAGMFLKGEGGDANHTRAVELYEKAASDGSVAALNGLGYAYFYGNHLPQVMMVMMGFYLFIFHNPRPFLL